MAVYRESKEFNSLVWIFWPPAIEQEGEEEDDDDEENQSHDTSIHIRYTGWSVCWQHHAG